MEKSVAIIGASSNPDRYSYKAQERLMAAGHIPFPVNPYGGKVLGVPCFTSVAEITDPIHTVTIYVAPQRLHGMIEAIISLAPQRIIFNPGTEDKVCRRLAEAAGIETLEACTLVMLATNQF